MLFRSLGLSRHVRFDLIAFLETIGLYLQCGYDLRYAWDESLRCMELSSPIRQLLDRDGQELGRFFARLGEEGALEPWAHWFSTLGHLADQGASLGPTVIAFSSFLRQEQQRDFEAFARRIPRRMGILLTLFFLPPTLLLLFAPLLWSLSQGF